MKNVTGLSAVLCLFTLSSAIVFAQETADKSIAPPKVIVIQREYLKPGRSGSPHEKTESAFVHAMTTAKWPTHYFGMDSLSGPSRSLFITGYPSFEAWEKDYAAMMKDTTLFAALDRASIADGDQLTAFDSSTYLYREDFSLRPSSFQIAHMRYFEISRFVIRPGHRREWEAMVKMYVSGFEKTVPNAHWVTFESMYGVDNGGVYLVFNPMKSLTEVDQGIGDNKLFAGSMSESEMKKLGELEAACVESSQTNLFAFNPKISYPQEEWIQMDAFWKPTTAATK